MKYLVLTIVNSLQRKVQLFTTHWIHAVMAQDRKGNLLKPFLSLSTENLFFFENCSNSEWWTEKLASSKPACDFLQANQFVCLSIKHVSSLTVLNTISHMHK